MEILLLGKYADGLVDRLARDHEVTELVAVDEHRAIELVSDANLVVVRSPHRITDEMLSAATDLRWIVRAGSGTDNISSTHRRHGVRVFTTPLNSRSVAELVFAMLFSLYRDLRPLHASILDGRWEKYDASGREVHGSSIAILGFGRIGRSVARIASGFEMDVRAFDRSPDEPEKVTVADRCDVTFGDFDSVVADADAVAVCLPLNEETRSLIDADALERFEDGSVLINVGRGAIVDLDAVYEAVTRGPLDGVGLDVYPDEPPDVHPLFDLDAVVCTPHVGAQTEQTRGRINRRIVEIIDQLPREVE